MKKSKNTSKAKKTRKPSKTMIAQILREMGFDPRDRENVPLQVLIQTAERNPQYLLERASETLSIYLAGSSGSPHSTIEEVVKLLALHEAVQICKNSK